MARRRVWPPKISRHKTGLARCRIDGKDYYLGKFGTEEVQRAYARLVAEAGTTGPIRPRHGMTVDELCLAYLHRMENQVSKSQIKRIACAVKVLSKLYGDTPAAEFGPRALEVVQVQFCKDGLCRRYANSLVGTIKTTWRWACRAELIPPERWHALAVVPGIPRGHPLAREATPVVPIARDLVLKTLPCCPVPVRAAIEFMLFTGCRTGEALALRPVDVHRDGSVRLVSGHVLTLPAGVWVYSPPGHKNLRRGGERHILIGPRCQAMLSPLMDREPTAYCFDPREAGPFTRSPKGQYSNVTFARAVARACTAANVEPWSPGQIRHTVATEVWAGCTPDAAQHLLGHSSLRMTEHYARLRDLTAAAVAAAKVG